MCNANVRFSTEPPSGSTGWGMQQGNTQNMPLGLGLGSRSLGLGLGLVSRSRLVLSAKHYYSPSGNTMQALNRSTITLPRGILCKPSIECKPRGILCKPSLECKPDDTISHQTSSSSSRCKVYLSRSRLKIDSLNFADFAFLQCMLLHVPSILKAFNPSILYSPRVNMLNIASI